MTKLSDKKNMEYRIYCESKKQSVDRLSKLFVMPQNRILEQIDAGRILLVKHGEVCPKCLCFAILTACKKGLLCESCLNKDVWKPELRHHIRVPYESMI